jgi:putative ABC transport system permease protein
LAERTSCIAGKALVTKYGWKIGDVIPITGTIYPGDWRLTLRGIYTASTPDADENTIFFHWDYLNEVMPEPRKNWVGIYWVRVGNASDAPAVSGRIDAIYENSPQPTKTETEKAFQAGFIQMRGT